VHSRMMYAGGLGAFCASLPNCSKVLTASVVLAAARGCLLLLKAHSPVQPQA
jgi:hypothetical protein